MIVQNIEVRFDYMGHELKFMIPVAEWIMGHTINYGGGPSYEMHFEYEQSEIHRDGEEYDQQLSRTDRAASYISDSARGIVE